MITKLFKIAFFQDHFTFLNVILIKFSKFSKRNKLLNILSKHSRKTFLLVICGFVLGHIKWKLRKTA